MLAQLAQWPLPIPYNRSSSPDSGNFYFDNYLPLPHHVTWRHKSVIIRRSNKNRRQEWNNYSWATFDATFLAYFLATFCRLSEQVKIIPSLSSLSFNLSIYHFVFLFSFSRSNILSLSLSIYHFTSVSLSTTISPYPYIYPPICISFVLSVNITEIYFTMCLLTTSASLFLSYFLFPSFLSFSFIPFPSFLSFWESLFFLNNYLSLSLSLSLSLFHTNSWTESFPLSLESINLPVSSARLNLPNTHSLILGQF